MSEKPWSKEFLEYEEFIVNHPNYKGLPITKSKDGKYNWIAPAQSETGKKRKQWVEEKGEELGIRNNFDGFYAAVMLSIHPTKEKPCQICGKTMSLYYHYPNANLAKSLKKEFGYECDIYESIFDICDNLKKNGIPENKIIEFLKSKCKLQDDYTDLETLITHCELKCRSGLSKMLGPGAMSNFPDRYDGFHTYNRCCRSSEDKGRSRENLKSYTRDRRAYEYFSDGNIQAANKFMNSSFFRGTSADHIIPVSLGGVHDPHYLQKMAAGENSSKRDRLSRNDVMRAVEIENKTGISAVYWYSLLLWEFLKSNVENSVQADFENFRNLMKQNINDFLEILYIIKSIPNEMGVEFIVSALIEPKRKFFEADYAFNADGSFKTMERHITQRAAAEFEQIKRISIESLDDYHEKENRHLSPDFSDEETEKIKELSEFIENGEDEKANSLLREIMELIQKRLIENLS